MWLRYKEIRWKTIVLAAVCVLLIQPIAYAAEEIDFKTKALNQIYFIDECMEGGGRFLNGGGGSMVGDTVQEKIISYYSGNNTFGVKMTDYAIAGILANIQAESGFNPFRFQSDVSSGAGYGIFQYTPKEKITSILRVDSRTAGIFNEYYDVKYSAAWNPEAAVPGSDIPESVLDAWLEVQLDAQSDPNSSAGELQKTTVGEYRNPSNDGPMGLDYISSNLTILEAMNEAKSASDAARIWLWIYERPGDKEGTFVGTNGNPGRGPLAEHHLAQVQKVMGSSGSGSSKSSIRKSNEKNAANVENEGKNVTIVGDSITKRAEMAGSFNAKLKNADVISEVGKHMFTDDGSNKAGSKIIEELISKNTLRDIVVIALGTNDMGGLTKDNVQGLVDRINEAGEHIIVFVTNYGVSEHDYTSNNNVFNQIGSTNANVVIADWAGVAGTDSTKYMDDDVHPKSGAGTDLFVETIYGALTGGVTKSQERQYNEKCPRDTIYDGESGTDGEGVSFVDYNGHTIAFPIAMATKDNISGGRGQGYIRLSNIPCSSTTGCHYGAGTDPAFDMCFDDSTKCDTDTPIVSMTDGTITRDIQTTRNNTPCNHVRIKSDIDGTVIAYMHLRYEEDLPWHAGDKVKAGDLIGHVSEVGACHDNSTPHVHIDKGMDPSATGGPSGPSSRDTELVNMMNAAYNGLPENDAELQTRLENDDGGGGNVGNEGLTYEQAKKIMMKYGANSGGESSKAAGSVLWNTCNGGGSNCVTFSAFFYNKFTSNQREIFGNGNEVVDNLLNDKNVKKTSKPKIWSVFSWSGGTNGWGHTGVILGKENGEWIVGHASCSNSGIGKGDGTFEGGGAGFVRKSKNIEEAILGVGKTRIKYANLSKIIDIKAMEDYLNSRK